MVEISSKDPVLEVENVESHPQSDRAAPTKHRSSKNVDKVIGIIAER